MDKLIEKFNGNNNLKTNQMYETAVKHANITKKVACGFKEWCDKLNPYELMATTTDLFDLYLKTL